MLNAYGKKMEKSHVIIAMNKIPYVSLVRLKTPNSENYNPIITNFRKSIDVDDSEETVSCLKVSEEVIDFVGNYNNDSEYDSDSSGSDISELEELDNAFEDAIRDDSIVLDVVDNIDLSFDFNRHLAYKSPEQIPSPSLPCSSTFIEDSTISNKNDATYEEEDEDSFTQNESQDQSHETSNLSLKSNENVPDNNVAGSNILLHAGAPDDEQMFLVDSGVRKRKKHFCYYCKTFQTVISRHLIHVHSEEHEVKELVKFKSKSRERNERLKLLRLKGNHLFNSSSGYNDGEKLVTRQPNKKHSKKASDYKICHNCFGQFYSIHRHRQKCLGEKSTHHRSNPILSRAVAGHIHENSSNMLRKLFSVMRDDKVSRIIRYDSLLISFGNELCEKYTKQQQHDMIRSRLRDLGKLLLQIKNNTDISIYIPEFSSLINPEMYKYILKAVKEITGANAENRSCRAPSTALSYGIYLKKIARSYRRQCLEDGKYADLQVIKYFLELHEDKYPIAINKLAHEIQTLNKRHKKVQLPIINDIKVFWSYLQQEFQKALSNIETEFSYNVYDVLNKSTLLLILLFNRKRAGELERVSIDDYKSAKKFSETNKEEYAQLSEEKKNLVDDYVRFEIGGKKDRNVPVIISREMRTGIDTLMLHRNKTEISNDNPMIFALPGVDASGRYKHLRICVLMREYSIKSGISEPKSMRTTLLRKHVATTVASLKIAESRIFDVSNFMGHAEEIHRQHYRQPVISRDLCDVSEILEVAVGMRQSSGITTDKETSIFNDNVIRSNVRKLQPIKETTECHHDTETDSNDSWYSINESKKKGAKKRNINIEGNKNTTKRMRWTDREIKTASDAFEENIMNMKLPTSLEIRKFLKSYPEVKRTEPQIRTWVHNQYKSQKKK